MGFKYLLITVVVLLVLTEVADCKKKKNKDSAEVGDVIENLDEEPSKDKKKKKKKDKEENTKLSNKQKKKCAKEEKKLVKCVEKGTYIVDIEDYDLKSLIIADYQKSKEYKQLLDDEIEKNRQIIVLEYQTSDEFLSWTDSIVAEYNTSEEAQNLIEDTANMIAEEGSVDIHTAHNATLARMEAVVEEVGKGLYSTFDALFIACQNRSGILDKLDPQLFYTPPQLESPPLTELWKYTKRTDYYPPAPISHYGGFMPGPAGPPSEFDFFNQPQYEPPYGGARGRGMPQFYSEPMYEPMYTGGRFNEPMYNEPMYNEPMNNPPMYNPPMYNPPMYTEPMYNDQMYNEPMYNEPMYNPPMYNEPMYNEPMYNEPMYNEPMYNDPMNNWGRGNFLSDDEALPSVPFYNDPAYNDPAYNEPMNNNVFRQDLTPNTPPPWITNPQPAWPAVRGFADHSQRLIEVAAAFNTVGPANNHIDSMDEERAMNEDKQEKMKNKDEKVDLEEPETQQTFNNFLAVMNLLANQQGGATTWPYTTYTKPLYKN